MTIGPVIDNGFYYDFVIKRPFTPEDLQAIEQRMAEIAKRDFPRASRCGRATRRWTFQRASAGTTRPDHRLDPGRRGRVAGPSGDFIDLCRGRMCPRPASSKVFKLMKLAGAYWRGDSKNEMLQRVYGTAWTKKDELDAYLHMIEEAEKRDHRKLGRQLDLFHLGRMRARHGVLARQGLDAVAAGRAVHAPHVSEHGYQEVKTPADRRPLAVGEDRPLGQLLANMFTTSPEKRDYAVKPMNCPGHPDLQPGLKSYRDLPLRMAEFGSCHRNEPPAAARHHARAPTSCRTTRTSSAPPRARSGRMRRFIRLLQQVTGLRLHRRSSVKLSTRPKARRQPTSSGIRRGRACRRARRDGGLQYELQPGEGAFYGPEDRVLAEGRLGRVWRCGTLQVDFNCRCASVPTHIDEDNTKSPVMLHRAILGSWSASSASLIETRRRHAAVAGPVQAVVMNIYHRRQAEYAEEAVAKSCKGRLPESRRPAQRKINYKFANIALQKLPYQIVIGDKEKAAGLVAVRTRGGQDLGQMSLDSLIERWRREVEAKAGSV